MNTHKRLVVAALLLVLATGFASAEIGENFEAAGIGLFGSARVYMDFGAILDSTSDYLAWSVEVAPGFEYFLIDTLALYLYPSVSFMVERYDSDNVDRAMSIGVDLGLSKAFVSDPSAQQGFVPAIGGGLGLRVYPGVGDKEFGVETDDQSLSMWGKLQVSFRLSYFVNDRLAPYVAVAPELWYWLSLKDSGGSSVTLLSEDRLYLDFSVVLGMSYYIPNKKASLFLQK